jgi:type IV pilus assembly protein PilC
VPTFHYAARDRAGRPQQGTQEAPSPAALVTALRDRGWLVLDVHPAASDDGSLVIADLVNPIAWLPPRSIDVELSLQQIAVMLRSGITLLAALETTAEHARRLRMQRIWKTVARRIQEGSSLADAMAEHRCFPHLAVQLVRVGEQTGNLEQVISRSAESLERRRMLRTSLLTALTYPAIVLVAAIGVSTFMILGVIPKLQVFLTAMGRRLPPMTQMLIDFSTFIRVNGPPILIGLVGVAVGMTLFYLWPPGRLILDRLLLRIPVVGRLLRLAATVLFARSLGVLIHSGITLVEGLRTVEQLHRNRYVSSLVAAARNAVLRGGSLAAPLAVRDAFMPMLSCMVAVGETAGTLDDVLEEVARFHEGQLQSAIRQFSAIIEPVIVIVVGAIVGFVYISFFMALFAAAGGPR